MAVKSPTDVLQVVVGIKRHTGYGGLFINVTGIECMPGRDMNHCLTSSQIRLEMQYLCTKTKSQIY